MRALNDDEDGLVNKPGNAYFCDPLMSPRVVRGRSSEPLNILKYRPAPDAIGAMECARPREENVPRNGGKWVFERGGVGVGLDSFEEC